MAVATLFAFNAEQPETTPRPEGRARCTDLPRLPFAGCALVP
jgi:hypothetical protein